MKLLRTREGPGRIRDELVLAHAAYLTEEGPRALLGEVGVPRENVAFVHRLEGARLIAVAAPEFRDQPAGR